MSSGLELRIDWHPQRVLAEVDHLGREASEDAGHLLLEHASGRVPFNTGELAASGDVESLDDGVAVGYRARHARYVHAHPEWNFQHGRSGRWLEETVSAETTEVGHVYEDTLRHGWPG